MNPVATTAQRRKTLRNIRHIEADMLRPGWDKGLEHQFGQALHSLPPIDHKTDDAEQRAAIEAWKRQRPQREAAAQRRKEMLNALIKWLLFAGVCAGLAITWIYHP